MNENSLRRLGVWTATLLVIANMIGTGVFTTSGFMVGNLSSAPAVMIAWMIGGLLALCGALVYGELVAALPRNGGEYQLLGRIYHPSVGFVAGWISLIVGFSAPIAFAAMMFGEYLNALVPGAPKQVAALILIALLTALHATHVTVGSKVQNAFTVMKVSVILALIGGGIFAGDFSRLGYSDGKPLHQVLFSPAFAVGLYYVSLSYSGWNGAAYVAGELRSPARNLPLALILGTGIVILLFLGVNLAILAAAPASELAAGKEKVGHVAAIALFGESAGRVLSGTIALALVSSVSAMIMAGPRVYHAIGEDHPRLSLLSYRTRRGGPLHAVVLQAVVAGVIALTATYDGLFKFIGFTLSLCTALVAIGVFYLRRREPGLPRPYRVWGHPFTTSLFLLLSAWMAWHALREEPQASFAGLGVILSGFVLYFLVRRRKR